MGVADFFSSTSGLENIFSKAGKFLGIDSESMSEDDQGAYRLGLTGMASNGIGLYKAITDPSSKGLGKGVGVAESLFGLIGSGAQTMGGALGRSGNKKGSDIAGYVGGASNLLSGGAGLVKAFSQYRNDGNTKGAIMSGLGGISKLFSGITGIGSTASDSKGWKYANIVSSLFGSLVGGNKTGAGTGG